MSTFIEKMALHGCKMALQAQELCAVGERTLCSAVIFAFEVVALINAISDLNLGPSSSSSETGKE